MPTDPIMTEPKPGSRNYGLSGLLSHTQARVRGYNTALQSMKARGDTDDDYGYRCAKETFERWESWETKLRELMKQGGTDGAESDAE